MSVENVRNYLKEFDLDKNIIEFTVSSATVSLAAAALGASEAMIAKSMAFITKKGRALMVVTSGDKKIDNTKFRNCFNEKAKMMSPEEVFAATGHRIGGVCPFCLNEGTIEVYLDESLKRFPFVYPAAGSASSCVKLTPEEVFLSAHAMGWVDVCI